jgi:hypothetical protein
MNNDPLSTGPGDGADSQPPSPAPAPAKPERRSPTREDSEDIDVSESTGGSALEEEAERNGGAKPD